jgi:hypothetical protein
MALPTLADVKARLNETGTGSDAEIQSMLDAALSYYRRYVGALDPVPVTETHSGPRAILRKYPVVAVTSVTDASGTAITGFTLNADAGLLDFPSGGTFTVAYTAGFVDVPADIREAIVLDVAGLYASSQRGGGGRQFGAYPDAGDGPTGFPVTLYPRIDMLRTAVVG